MLTPVVAAAVTQPASSADLLTAASSKSSLTSSPRQYPIDLPHPILEESDESDSEAVIEPVTPVSGRQSQDFQTLASADSQLDATQERLAAAFPPVRQSAAPGSKPPLTISPPSATAAVVPKPSPGSPPQTSRALPPQSPAPPTPSIDQEPLSSPPSRRSTFSSTTSNFRRTMSSLLRRGGGSQEKVTATASVDGMAPLSLPDAAQRKMPSRRWSMHRSSATTRSNSPPSPESPPLEMAIRSSKKQEASKPTVPDPDAFNKKKSRASTNFILRSRPSGSAKSPEQLQLRRRASSFDYGNKKEKPAVGPTSRRDKALEMERSLWPLPAETGTGVKARRLSLSLPDDFTVDVTELMSEFEYQHKLLGRHGKHLGKGATSKVTLMVSKNGGELFAVKEFRGKSSSETKEEYEKKIKSEYTLAKSLHHPNIVDTIRLCIDKGRWNHVMEYCEDGDLFTLVSKQYLKTDEREKDRLCLFKQLVNGINYLHSNGIAHRDIKLENLLITKDSRLKITDFGVSEVFSGLHPGLREAGGQCGRNMGEVRLCRPGICGSIPYISPEVLKKQHEYDPRGLDVWSAAIVMLNLIFGGPLWQKAEVSDNAPKHDTYSSLVRGWAKWSEKHPPGAEMQDITDMDYPHVYVFDTFVKPPALRRVLLQMLNPDPARRISIANVANNRWVKNIECCTSESFDDPAPGCMIDASKKPALNRAINGKKIYCHNHMPPKENHGHSIGKIGSN
ncbi:hypothetical protein VTJ83DRAFT_1585 [Remersonia thermophila]|uniref:Protein kinase domain-containing protein n=1 Tax=Remersonia thermophila TaxID=72144 RepID=A0ABR4DGD4_9PEZI